MEYVPAVFASDDGPISLHGVPIMTDAQTLAIDLRTYGEDELAARVATMSLDDLQPVFDRADHYLYLPELATPKGTSPLLALCLALAAVEIIEGQARPLRWKRRKLKGIYPGM